MRLAAINLPAAQNAALYTVPADSRAIFTVSLCNRTAAATKVRIALTNGAAPTDADWIEYETTLASSGVLERTGLALSAGQAVFCRASVEGISAVAYGVQEAI